MESNFESQAKMMNREQLKCKIHHKKSKAADRSQNHFDSTQITWQIQLQSPKRGKLV